MNRIKRFVKLFYHAWIAYRDGSRDSAVDFCFAAIKSIKSTRRLKR